MFAQQKRARALSLDDDIEEITSLPGAPLKRIRTDPPARSGEEIELSSSDELADEEEEPVPEQVKELVDEGLRLCLVPTIRQRGGVGQGQGQEDGEIALPCDAEGEYLPPHSLPPPLPAPPADGQDPGAWAPFGSRLEFDFAQYHFVELQRQSYDAFTAKAHAKYKPPERASNSEPHVCKPSRLLPSSSVDLGARLGWERTWWWSHLACPYRAAKSVRLRERSR
ncbi:hypothetical protein B0H10DRAFT_1960568 [Mycena sp. CBHHK59/15]|nr:hypothetical protein B0H10DRAFT_1960568 [Mycena sp. CBHHK59/15]